MRRIAESLCCVAFLVALVSLLGCRGGQRSEASESKASVSIEVIRHMATMATSGEPICPFYDLAKDRFVCYQWDPLREWGHTHYVEPSGKEENQPMALGGDSGGSAEQFVARIIADQRGNNYEIVTFPANIGEGVFFPASGILCKVVGFADEKRAGFDVLRVGTDVPAVRTELKCVEDCQRITFSNVVAYLPRNRYLSVSLEEADLSDPSSFAHIGPPRLVPLKLPIVGNKQ